MSQLHQCILDTSITVRVELHGMSYDVGHLVETTIVHALHRVHNTPLDWLKAICNVRHCTFQNYIGCIVKEPVLVHLVQVVGDAFYHCPECQKKLEGVVGLLEGQRMAIEPAFLERKERSKNRNK